MYTRSENCPRRELCIQNGKGLVELKDLTDQEGLYGHGRMFAHVTIRPGCSIGDHPHVHETEFYYILKGEGVSTTTAKKWWFTPATSAPRDTARCTEWRTGPMKCWK